MQVGIVIIQILVSYGNYKLMRKDVVMFLSIQMSFKKASEF